MPRYDIQCEMCGAIHEVRMTYAQHDSISAKHGFVTECPTCELLRTHMFVIIQAPQVEWKTDGAYNYDNADSITKYQREHFADSGDIGEKKLIQRRKKRGHK